MVLDRVATYLRRPTRAAKSSGLRWYQVRTLLEPARYGKVTEETGPGNRAHATWFTPGVAGIGGASLPADIGHEIPTALLTEADFGPPPSMAEELGRDVLLGNEVARAL